MKTFLFLALAIVAVLGAPESTGDPITTKFPPPTIPTTTTPPTTTTTPTTATTTTTAPTTTTTSVKTTTTSVKTTTGPPAPTTTAPPKDKPAVGSWAFKKDKNYCLRVDFGVRFQFNYTADKNVTSFIDLPSNKTEVKLTGFCDGDGDQWLQLEFNGNWTFRLDFKKNGTTKPNKFYLSAVTLNYNMEKKYFPDIKTEVFGETSELTDLIKWETDVDKSYQCMSDQYFHGFDNTSALDEVFYVELQAQAYMNSTKSDFLTAMPCPADTNEVSNLVPIVVGAALGGLVIIVLIAYLIGRRKSKRGYESV